MRYAEAHMKEMAAMSQRVKKAPRNFLPLQKLPRHMRRRAANHNVKRLPRAMRAGATKEVRPSWHTHIS